MKREAHSVPLNNLTILDRFNRCLCSQPRPQQRFARFRAKISLGSRDQVIRMCVRDDRAIHRLPRIYVKVACCAIEAARIALDEVFHRFCN